MASLTDYFAKRDADLPKEKFQMGSRVFGHWNKIPFVASVLRDVNKMVMVQTDLPVKYKDSYHTILSVPQKDVKLLKSFEI
jgi:hypothetical protein